jgi:hypothetical protein
MKMKQFVLLCAAHKAKIHRMQLISKARTGGVEGDAEQILDDVLGETEEAAPLNPLLAAKMKGAADMQVDGGAASVEVDEKVPAPKHVSMKEVLAKGGTLRTRLIKLFDYPADTVGALRGRA